MERNRAVETCKLVDRATAPLLSGYIKSIASHELLTSQADLIEAELAEGRGDLKTLNRLHAMIERQARLIQTFATKLRLTSNQLYRSHCRCNGRQGVRASPVGWEEMIIGVTVTLYHRQ